MNEKIQEEIKLLNAFYEYLKINTNDCILDVINDFCFEKNIPVEEIGYLISQDPALKTYAEENLKRFKYIKQEKPKEIEIW